MNTTELYFQFLTANKLMQLATQSEKGLWVCNVYFASDDGGVLYWTSARHRRHSIEIEANPSVAATIVHDPDKKQAIQIAGRAQRVSLDESAAVHQLYGSKYGQKESRLEEVMQDTPESRAYWRLDPSLIQLWDEVNFSDEPKQTVRL